MVITKRLNLNNIFLFLFLAIFPFGQIIRIGIIQPIDVIVGVAALYAIIKKMPRPEIFKYLQAFLIIAAASWIFSVFLLHRTEVLYGLLYLIRLGVYFYFLIYVSNFVRTVKNSKTILIDSLLSVSVASAIFGWIQYFVYPGFGAFMVWGWDEHLLRLAGTFLDPTFLGLILVFGSFIAIYRKKWVVLAFLVVSIAFTYSRGSYLAFLGGLLVILYFARKLKYFFVSAAVFLIIILLLPTSQNHILSVTREFSAVARLQNYVDSINIFKLSPVFGIGYDNLCLVNERTTGYINFASHACSGFDSSLLLILATTGIIGFIVFISSLMGIIKRIPFGNTSPLVASTAFALFIHSLFSNSLVYPWILGWVIILLGVSLRGEVKG